MKKIFVGTLTAITLTATCYADPYIDSMNRIREQQQMRQMKQSVIDLEHTNRILQIDIETKLRQQQMQIDTIKRNQDIDNPGRPPGLSPLIKW